MTYSVNQDYGKEAQERVRREFHRKSVEDKMRYLDEDCNTIQDFTETAREQLALIDRTELIPEVQIDKDRNYATNHINYRINSYLVPQVPDGDKMKVFCFYGEGKIIAGGDAAHRKEAIEYALELSRKHGGCKIVGNAAELCQKGKP
jgi:hypothetical protein